MTRRELVGKKKFATRDTLLTFEFRKYVIGKIPTGKGQTDVGRRMWMTGWGASVWREGRTVEDRLMYGTSVKAATSGDGYGYAKEK